MTSGNWSGSHSSGFPPYVRKQIHVRAGYRCEHIDNGQRCTNTSTDADHIVPKAEGGSDSMSNGQALCGPHHTEKTKAEQARGRARHSRRRTAGPHPGLR